MLLLSSFRVEIASDKLKFFGAFPIISLELLCIKSRFRGDSRGGQIVVVCLKRVRFFCVSHFLDTVVLQVAYSVTSYASQPISTCLVVIPVSGGVP